MKQQMLSKVLLSTVVVMGSIAGSSLVMDDNAHAEQKSDNIGKLNQKNESTLHLSFEKGIKGTVDKNGKLTLSDGKTSKVMPTNAKDKKGNDVVLVYKKVKDGFDVQVIKSSQERKTNWVKCGLGTVAGAIIGGVSGGATGAAASCFG
ncbi:TPA: hypothetical protein ACRUA2_000900 [Staphylococcus aureus]